MTPARRIVAGIVVLGLALVASGCSQLIDAAYRGDVEAVRTLLDQGVSPDERTAPYAPTGLEVAASRGDLPTMELLLDRGANINAGSNSGNAIISASRQGHLKAVQLLADRGADVNARTHGERNGWTALHEAAYAGHTDIVQFLLQRGALAGEKNADDETPAAVAKLKGRTTLARLLERADAQQLTSVQPVELAIAAPPAMTMPAPALPASDVDAPSVERPAKPNRYAVVVGIEQYRNKLPKADFAAQDARTMGAYLTKTMGFSEENVAILVNENATKTDLEKYLEHWLPNRVEKDGMVFVYYSGHGAPNPKTGDAYLVPYDGDPAFVDATGYPLKRLYEQVGKLPAKEVVVLLDSCFSGAGGRSVIGKGMRPMVLSVENPVLAGGKTVVLAASKGDQVSSTYDPKGHGLLTYFFLKGLRGAADTNKDGSVDLAEVYDYLKPQVERTARREYNNDQQPQLLGNPAVPAKNVRLVERAQ